ncbi:hypothetical protein KVR01_012119 [Diaporthe batatas]|uniref:uncharacterized protein n=1 Tax=Diaporthe batatas TaxID=748121 RepID=UPI001D04C671|nr:uncharacterized protein KVR01_012119 [Diaporthe batatas]KAG8158358.1 hypothetical protein KVR01_012119 [Diaporthe batatas]
MTSPLNSSSIPPITALRQELDYGDPTLARCQAFYDSTRLFRKTFVSSQGWDGSSIHDWKSREHQVALGEMVRSYLEQHKNGRFFWPDDKSSSRANKFQYSTDSGRIKRVMRQLFWRLNIQQFRNSKYRSRGRTSGPREKKGREPSQELGIETDHDVGVGASASRDAAGTPATPRSSTFINLTDSPLAVQTDVVNHDSSEAQIQPAMGFRIIEDPYRVPDSPGPRVLPPQDQPTFAVISTGIDDDGHQVAPVANMDPSTMPPRGDDRSSARMSKKRAGKQPAGVCKSRISPRKRKLRSVRDQATEDEVQAAIQSPQRSPSPPVVAGPAPAETNHRVTSDIVPPWDRDRASRLRTMSEVTDQAFSVNGFVRELGSATGPEPTEPGNTTNHAEDLAQPTATKATPQPSIEVKSPTTRASLIPLVSSSVPPENIGVVGERPIENKLLLQATPPVGQPPRVEFTYCVVCRYPELQSKSWKPEGSFRNKTLSKLEEELPIHLDWSQFQYLHFDLTAPNTHAEHLVRHGSEDQFDFMKRQLAVIIRDCIANTPRGKTITVGIVIEPLPDENALKKSADNEVMDFEW